MSPELSQISQITAMARNGIAQAHSRIEGSKSFNLDQTIEDLDQLIEAQQQAVNAIDEHLDAHHACRAAYQYGDLRQVAEAWGKARQELERLQRSKRGLERFKHNQQGG